MKAVMWVGPAALAAVGVVVAMGSGPALAQGAAPAAAACTDGSGPTSGFFCAPRAQGNPVQACPTANASGAVLAACRQTTADSFCRTVAFSSAAAFQVDARGTLAEVTCRGRQAPGMTMAQTTPPRPAVAPTPPRQAVSPPPPPPPVPVAAPQDYVYGTVFNADRIRPTLQVSPFGPTMTGTYTMTNPRADFDAIYQRGGGSIVQGRLEGTFSGNVFRGRWYERENEQGLSYVQRTCDREEGGTRVWGFVTLNFSPDRRSYVGTMATCDDYADPEQSLDKDNWRGTLTGRAAAAR